MDYAKFIALLKKQSSTHELSEQEQKELNALNEKDPKLTKQLGKVWDLSGRYESQYQPNLEKGLEHLRQRMKEEKQEISQADRKGVVVRMKNWYWLAAAMVVGLILSIPILTQQDLPVYYTTNAEVKEVLLPDGSTVVLNENSVLRLEKDFVKGKRRTISLEGEAFFDIQSDPDHPFKIITQETSVEVLGTEFMLRAYPAEDSTVVEVSEGKVLFADARKELLLETNTIGACFHKTKVLEKKEAPTLELPEWYKFRTQAFRNAPIQEFIYALEDRFDIEMSISKSLLSNSCPITITVQKNESLESILKRLEVSFNGEIKTIGEFSYQIIKIVC